MGRLRCGGDGFGGLDDKLFMLMTRRRGSATIWLALLRLKWFGIGLELGSAGIL
jgi:hypothetical protein